MAIPGYQEFMLPLLELAGDGREHTVRESLVFLAEQMGISAEDQQALLPSGTKTRYYNRLSWALTYLTKSALLEKTGRGRFRITERGRAELSKHPRLIDDAYLEQFPEYRQFVSMKGTRRPLSGDGAEPERVAVATPEEHLEAAYSELRGTLADELLERVRQGTPAFFEQLVVDVLVAMGYGGSRADAAQVVGRSGDEGIDGVIKEDRLGLDTVYVQAKRWQGSVGSPEIDRFVGSLSRKKAQKGVFITSGTFTDSARTAAREAAMRIVLIDGVQLAELMIDHGVGVADARSFVVKRVDIDYFEEM
jgi:restriction system protein